MPKSSMATRTLLLGPSHFYPSSKSKVGRFVSCFLLFPSVAASCNQRWWWNLESTMLQKPCAWVRRQLKLGSWGALVSPDLCCLRSIVAPAEDMVSATFTKPIKLEFEKVYCPYLLMNKKQGPPELFKKLQSIDFLVLGFKALCWTLLDQARAVWQIGCQGHWNGTTRQLSAPLFWAPTGILSYNSSPAIPSAEVVWSASS